MARYAAQMQADRRCATRSSTGDARRSEIFIEVALTRGVARACSRCWTELRGNPDPGPATRILLSITKCQEGLGGVVVGNLPDQEVGPEDSAASFRAADLCERVSFSGLRRWLTAKSRSSARRCDRTLERIDAPEVARRPRRRRKKRENGPAVEILCTPSRAATRRYGGAFPIGKGARLEGLKWLGDTSPIGMPARPD